MSFRFVRVLLVLFGLVAWLARGVAAQGEAGPAERQIHWQRSLEDALSISSAEQRPLFIAINFDGESASDRIVIERYRDPRFVAWTRRAACLVASVARHNPRDYDAEGRRIPCPRLGEVTCGEHIALEPLVFERFLGGERVSPRHALVQPDGTKTFDLFLLFDLADLDRELAQGAEAAPPPLAPVSLPAVLAKKKRQDRLQQWRLLARQRTAHGRAAFESVVSETKDEGWIGEALDAVDEVGDAGATGVLRLLVARDPVPGEKLLQRIGSTASALKLGPAVARMVRDRFASLGAYPGWPGLSDERALLPLLARFGGQEPTTRSFLLAHTAIGNGPDRAASARALAPLLAMPDVSRVAAAVEAEGGPCEFPDLLLFAREVTRGLVRIEPPVELPVPVDVLERELEEADRALAAEASDPERCARFGRAALRLGKSFADAGGPDPSLHFEDARQWLSRAAESRPDDVKLAFDRARAAYYLGRFEEEERLALAAFGSFPPRDALDPELPPGFDSTRVADGDVRRAATVLHDADKIEALRWVGDAAARLLGTRERGDPAVEIAGFLRAARALSIVAVSPLATDTDWLSLGSFLRAVGLEREAAGAFEAGAARHPESAALRDGLNGVLWGAGRLDLAAPKAEWIAAQNPRSGDAAYFAAYAWILGAEDARREERPPAALEAYARAAQRFEDAIVLRPDLERNAAHFAAMSKLGAGFAQFALGSREAALDALVAAVRRSPTVLDARDGLDRDVPDLVDALLEWRAGQRSPLDPLQVAERLGAALPGSSRLVLMVADSELREALRADGRSSRTTTTPAGETVRLCSEEGDAYMEASIAIARRACAIEETEATRVQLAQSLAVHAERALSRDETSAAAPWIAEAAALLGVEPPSDAADPRDVARVAGELRAILGPARPVFRPGR